VWVYGLLVKNNFGRLTAGTVKQMLKEKCLAGKELLIMLKMQAGGNFLRWFFHMCNIKKLMVAVGFVALYTCCFTVYASLTPHPLLVNMLKTDCTRMPQSSSHVQCTGHGIQ
jgi:hypothetical protein